MTAALINLRRVRKAKARVVAAERAAENRARHGESKAERALATATETINQRFFDAHKRETAASTDISTDREDGSTLLQNETGIVKRSLTIAGHRTSISLERVFWDALGQLAAARGQSVAALVAEIDAARSSANLSSAVRVFVLQSRPSFGPHQ